MEKGVEEASCALAEDSRAETANDKTRERLSSALRLLNPPADKALTYELYMRTIEEHLNSLDTDAKAKMVLLKLREYGETLYREILE